MIKSLRHARSCRVSRGSGNFSKSCHMHTSIYQLFFSILSRFTSSYTRFYFFFADKRKTRVAIRGHLVPDTIIVPRSNFSSRQFFSFFFFLSPFFPTPERHESLNEDKRTANSNTRTREQEAEPKLVKRNALNLHVLLIITSSTTHAPFIPIKQLFFARKDHFFARPKYIRDSLIFIIILLRVIYCYLRYLITSKTILRYK